MTLSKSNIIPSYFQVSEQVINQVGYQLRNQVECQLRNQVYDQVRNQLWNQVWFCFYRHLIEL